MFLVTELCDKDGANSLGYILRV